MSQKWLIKTKVTVFLHLFGCGFFRYIFQANQPQGHPMPPPPPLGFERPPRTYRLLAKIRLSLRKWNSRLGRLFFFFLYSSCLTQLAKTFPGEGGHHIQCPSLGRTICSFSCNIFFFFFCRNNFKQSSLSDRPWMSALQICQHAVDTPPPHDDIMSKNVICNFECWLKPAVLVTYCIVSQC